MLSNAALMSAATSVSLLFFSSASMAMLMAMSCMSLVIVCGRATVEDGSAAPAAAAARGGAGLAAAPAAAAAAPTERGRDRAVARTDCLMTARADDMVPRAARLGAERRGPGARRRAVATARLRWAPRRNLDDTS